MRFLRNVFSSDIFGQHWGCKTHEVTQACRMRARTYVHVHIQQSGYGQGHERRSAHTITHVRTCYTHRFTHDHACWHRLLPLGIRTQVLTYTLPHDHIMQAQSRETFDIRIHIHASAHSMIYMHLHVCVHTNLNSRGIHTLPPHLTTTPYD